MRNSDYVPSSSPPKKPPPKPPVPPKPIITKKLPPFPPTPKVINELMVSSEDLGRSRTNSIDVIDSPRPEMNLRIWVENKLNSLKCDEYNTILEIREKICQNLKVDPSLYSIREKEKTKIIDEKDLIVEYRDKVLVLINNNQITKPSDNSVNVIFDIELPDKTHSHIFLDKYSSVEDVIEKICKKRAITNPKEYVLCIMKKNRFYEIPGETSIFGYQKRMLFLNKKQKDIKKVLSKEEMEIIDKNFEKKGSIELKIENRNENSIEISSDPSLKVEINHEQLDFKFFREYMKKEREMKILFYNEVITKCPSQYLDHSLKHANIELCFKVIDLFLCGDLWFSSLVTSVEENNREQFVEMITKLFESKSNMINLLKLLSNQISPKINSKSLFSGTPIVCSFLTAYSFKFIHAFLQPSIKKVLEEFDEHLNLEIVNSRLPEGVSQINNSKNLVAFIEMFVNEMNLIYSRPFPVNLKYFLNHFKNRMLKTLEKDVVTRLLSIFIFRHMICPVLKDPKSFEHISELKKKQINTRYFELVAIVLECVSSGMPFERNMEVMEQYRGKLISKTDSFVNISVSKIQDTNVQMAQFVEKNSLEEEEIDYNPEDILSVLSQVKVNLFYQLFQDGYSKEEIQYLSSSLIDLKKDEKKFVFQNNYSRNFSEISAFLSNSSYFLREQMHLL